MVLQDSLGLDPPPNDCRVAECGRPAKSHGLCSGHAERLRRHGDVSAEIPLATRDGARVARRRVCHAPGCDNPKRFGRGVRYCSDECRRAAMLGTKREQSAAWRDGHPRESRTRHLWSRYRLTPEDIASRLLAQDGGCAICDQPFSDSTGWHVDHDHSCCPGRKSCGDCVRGLLCGRCNRNVLPVIEGPLLNKALAYLKAARA